MPIIDKGLEHLFNISPNVQDIGLKRFNTLFLGTGGVVDHVNEIVKTSETQDIEGEVLAPFSSSDTELQNKVFEIQGQWSKLDPNLTIVVFEATIPREQGDIVNLQFDPNEPITTDNPTGKRIYTEFGFADKSDPDNIVLLNRTVISPSPKLTTLSSQISETISLPIDEPNIFKLQVNNDIIQLLQVEGLDNANQVVEPNLISFVDISNSEGTFFILFTSSIFTINSSISSVRATYTYKKPSYLVKTKDFSMNLKFKVNALRPISI